MQRRIIGVFCFMILMSLLVIGILYLLASDSALAQRSMQQSLRTVVLQQSRAPILDRNLQPLTDTEEQLWGLIYPNAASLTQQERGLVLDGEDLSLHKPITARLRSPSYTEHIYPFVRTVRSGAQSLAVHIIGYVDGDDIGAAGLERAFDPWLTQMGSTAKVTYYVDGKGNPFEHTVPALEQETGQGALVLTLDRDLQQIAEKAAETYVEKGAIVILDVKNGDILASCSMPDLSPNNMAQQLDDPDQPFNNRAFMAYNTGSVFKPVVAAAALESGMEDFVYTCTGAVTVEGVTFRCNNIAGHGALNMEEAICQSCNPYFIALGLEIGYDRVYSMASAMGLGTNTTFADGVSSASGSLPSPTRVQSKADSANIFFGQGLLTATPLQMARMMSVIAGDGTLQPINLIKGLYQGGDETDTSMTHKGAVQVLSADTAARLRTMLKTVVDRGSGTAAAPSHGGAAGKTGSAQTGWYDDDGTEIVQGWFVGFYPYNDPQYAIAVVAEDSLYGSTAAAPAFRYICNRIFVEKGI